MNLFLTILKGILTVAIAHLVGAIFFWLIKGCKTKFSDELDQHGTRNWILGSLLWGLIAALLIWLGWIKL
jgi:hypothetical protein